MTKKRTSRWCLLISLMLLACAPAAAQSTDGLGGNWNNPTSATITNIIMARYGQPGSEKTPGESASRAKSNDASLHFRSTGTPEKAN